MIVTLDGQRLETPFEPGCTLGTVVDQVRDEHLGDRLVVGVALNGQTMVHDDLEINLDRALKGDDQVDLESADRNAVAVDALRAISEQLGSAARLQPLVADQLVGPGAGEAIRQVGDVVEVWNTCTQAIAQCSGLLGRDLTQVVYQDRPMRERLDDLLTKLQELRTALEARDYVLLADLLHYEMPETCQAWQGLLAELAADIQRSAQAAGSGH